MDQSKKLPKAQRAINNFSKAMFFLLTVAFISIPVMNFFVRHIWTNGIQAFKLVLPVAFGAIGFILVIITVLYRILEIHDGLKIEFHHLAILGFGVFIIVSTIASINFSTNASVTASLTKSLVGYGTRMEGALALFGYMGLFAAGMQIKTHKLLNYLLQIIVAVLIVTNLYAYAEHAYAHFPVILRSRRAFAFCGNANFYASFLIIGISILTIALVYNSRLLNNATYPGLILLTGIGIVHINQTLGVIFFAICAVVLAVYAALMKTQSSYTMLVTSTLSGVILLLFGDIMALDVDKIGNLGTAIQSYVLTPSHLIPRIIISIIIIAAVIAIYLAITSNKNNIKTNNQKVFVLNSNEKLEKIADKINSIMTPVAQFVIISFATLIMLFNNTRSAWVGIAAVWVLIGVYIIATLVKVLMKKAKNGSLGESLIFAVYYLIIIIIAAALFLVVYLATSDLFLGLRVGVIALAIICTVYTIKNKLFRSDSVEIVLNRGTKLIACALIFLTCLSYITIYQADLYKTRVEEVTGDLDNKSSANVDDNLTDNNDIMQTNKTTKNDKYKLEKWGSGRGFIWKYSIPVMFDRPITGYGPDNFKEAFPHSELQSEMKNVFGKSLTFDKAHNEYLQMGVTLGIPALIFYLALLVFVFRAGIKKSKNSIIKLSLFAAFTGYIVQAFFNISVLQVAPFHYAIMGMLVARMADFDPMGSPDFDLSELDGGTNDDDSDKNKKTNTSFRKNKKQPKAYQSL